MRSKKHWGSLAAGLVAGALLLPFGALARAADPTPGSDQGGSPGPSAPAEVKVSTELPKEIKVAHSSGKTTLTAKILNRGTKDTGPITLTVLGLDGMRITGVDGCAAVPENKLPKGTNTGFACPIDHMTAGAGKTYTVDVTYDLNRTGKICLPVTEGTEGAGGKLLWQQGPVPFGTTRPTPNAPDTPLLLGTDNVPAPPPGGSASPAPAAPGTPAPAPPSQLPRTGVNDGILPLLAAACLLLFVGTTGVWWAHTRHHHHRRRTH